MDKVMEIKQHLEKIEKLEQTLPVFEESDELYLDVLHKIQGSLMKLATYLWLLVLNLLIELGKQVLHQLKRELRKYQRWLMRQLKNKLRNLKMN